MAFLCLETLDSTSTIPEAIWNGETTNKKHKNTPPNMVLNRLQKKKKKVFAVQSLNQEGQSSPCWPQVGMWALGNSGFSSLDACPWITAKVLQELTWGSQMQFSSRESVNMESMNNKNLLFFHYQGESLYLRSDTHTEQFS